MGAGGLDLTQNPSQVGEKDKKSEKKKLCSERDLNPRPSDYRSCT